MAPALLRLARPAGTPFAPPATLLAIVFAAALLGAACDQEAKNVTADPDRSAAGAATAEATETAADDSATAAGDSAEPSTDDTSTADPGPAGGTPSAAGGKDGAKADAEPVKGKQETTDAYGTWLQSSGRYVAGKPASVQAVLVAKGNFKCNEKYPFKFKLDPPSPGVSYPNKTVRGISYGKERSTLTIPFTPSKAGQATISGTFYVSVCDPSKCKIGKQKLSVTVTVEAS